MAKGLVNDKIIEMVSEKTSQIESEILTRQNTIINEQKIIDALQAELLEMNSALEEDNG